MTGSGQTIKAIVCPLPDDYNARRSNPGWPRKPVADEGDVVAPEPLGLSSTPVMVAQLALLFTTTLQFLVLVIAPAAFPPPSGWWRRRCPGRRWRTAAPRRGQS